MTRSVILDFYEIALSNGLTGVKYKNGSTGIQFRPESGEALHADVESPQAQSLVKMVFKHGGVRVSSRVASGVLEYLADDASGSAREIFNPIKRFGSPACVNTEESESVDSENHELLVLKVDDGKYISIGMDEIKKKKSVEMHFCYEPDALPFPKPELDTPAEELIPLLGAFTSISRKADLLLLVAYVINLFITSVEFPLLLLTGPRGSGKSFLARLIKRIVDPRSHLVLKSPVSVRDVLNSVHSGFLIVFDNVGTLSKQIQDLMCVMATGGGQLQRKLFTDRTMLNTELRRPILMTGIANPITQDDLAERALVIQVPPLTSEDYAKGGGAAEFEEKLQQQLPRIFGALINAVRLTLVERKNLNPKQLPRMGDFGLTGIAVERIMSFPDGAFQRAYDVNRYAASRSLVECSTIAQYLIKNQKSMSDTESVRQSKLLTKVNLWAKNIEGLAPYRDSRTLGEDLTRVTRDLLEYHGIEIISRVRRNSGYHIMIRYHGTQKG